MYKPWYPLLIVDDKLKRHWVDPVWRYVSDKSLNNLLCRKVLSITVDDIHWSDVPINQQDTAGYYSFYCVKSAVFSHPVNMMDFVAIGAELYVASGRITGTGLMLITMLLPTYKI